MKNIVFSVIASAVRSHFYEEFYNCLNEDNKIPFEIVFAGDSPPKKVMPDNFRYIETGVKPIQCFEITARHSVGEYILMIGDDFLFNKEFLNKMYSHIERNKNEKVIIAPRYNKGSKKIKCVDEAVPSKDDNPVFFNKKIKGSPLIGITAALRRDLWHEYGGYDNRFLGVFADCDMRMRFLEKGYKVVTALDCCCFERYRKANPSRDNSNLISRSGERKAQNILDMLWITKKGKISKNRLLPVESFKDKDILVKSQGEVEKSLWV